MTVAIIGNNYEIPDLRAVLQRNGTYATRQRSAIRYIVIHHSGTAVDSQPTAIAKYHVSTLGWPGIGYHFVVRQGGDLYHTMDLGLASYNVAGRNHEVVGICLPGDWTHQSPPEAQLVAARRLVAEVQYDLGWHVPVVGHRDIALPGHWKPCPGDTWPQWRERVTVVAPAPSEPSEVDLDFGEYGRTWREVAIVLRGIATDALEAGRRQRDLATEVIETWGGR